MSAYDKEPQAISIDVRQIQLSPLLMRCREFLIENHALPRIYASESKILSRIRFLGSVLLSLANTGPTRTQIEIRCNARARTVLTSP